MTRATTLAPGMSTAFLDAVHADPWAESFLDLPSLNASASDAIEGAIRKVGDVARVEPQGLRSSSLVVLGPPGAGKTHLFARLRRKLGPRAIFVHVRPLVHAEITPRFLLGGVVRQLGYTSHGLSALPQIHAMVGSLLAQLEGEDMFFPTAFLAECESLSDADREVRLDGAVERVLELWQDVDESYLRRLLQVPFAKVPGVRRSMLAWLSGRDCDVTQLSRIGATASLDETLSVPALRTLAVVAAMGAPIVIVFDQLENLVDTEGPGARLLSYANLTAELVDSTRGLVLVHMALDTEWSRGIEPALNLSQRSRLLMARDTLSLPSTKQREELLELWSSQLPDRAAAYPWPFTEAQVQRLCQQPGVTPRMLLLDFRRALNGEFIDEPGNEAPSTAGAEVPGRTGGDEQPGTGEQRGLLEEWAKRLEEARNAAAEASEQRACLDPSRLADGLLACGRFLTDAKFSSMKGAELGQLRLTTSRGAARLAILHHGHHRSLGSVLKKLTTAAQQESVVAVRERSHELLPTWKDTLAKRNALLATQRARWVWLDGVDAVTLLALDSLLQGARSGDISDEHGKPSSEADVAAWVSANLNIAELPIIRDILSAESSQPTPQDEEAPRDRKPSPGSGAAVGVLRRLRVASLDRVVREVIRVDPRASRAAIVAELEASSDQIAWFGRTIVAVRVS